MLQACDYRHCFAIFSKCFLQLGASYNLPVTDPHYAKILSQLDCGRHEITASGLNQDQSVLLVISLGEAFPPEDGYCYKLVVGIVPIPA